MFSSTATITIAFLLCASFLSGMVAAVQRLGKLQTEENFNKIFSPFFSKWFLSFFFGKEKWEGLLFSLSFTHHLLRIGFVFSSFFFLLKLPFFHKAVIATAHEGVIFDGLLILGIILSIVILSLIFDFVFSLLGQAKPWGTLKVFAPLSSLILFLCSPLTAPFFRILKVFLPKTLLGKKLSPTFRIRDKVQEVLQESELGAYLDSNEQKLILSVVSFKERIAREVMVPRINVFSLSSDLSLEEATQSFFQEGYSRIPVYKETVDEIIGVLHYKDVLMAYVQDKQQKIDKLIKPLFYTPETKKISQLLQEFRLKQIHLAVVVDEWGGTEGIVTIEDILEELVGEISDEYDVAHPELFTPLPGGGWIVDAKMTILDIEEELGVKIPHGPEYDTIGGYIFQRAGSIPSKGWKIHHDDFTLEVLSSNERTLGKIRIIPY